MFKNIFIKNALVFRLFISIALALALVFLLMAVQWATAAPESAPNAVIYISGTIFNSTWTPTNIYIITGNASVDSSSTLTITAGTIVKFYSNVSLTVNGTMVLTGVQNNEVRFTSIRDDEWGGDTNGDGGDTIPAPGDWNSIILPNNNTTFQRAIVRYSRYGLQVKNSSTGAIAPHILNNIFNYNKNGVFLDINSSGVISSTIEDNSFSGNEYGLSTKQESSKTGTALPILRSNSFNTSTILPINLGGSAFPTYENNSFIGYPNPDQRLGIGLGGNFTYEGTLPQVEYAAGLTLPYVVIEKNLTVSDGYTLTLPLHTVIKFNTIEDTTNPGKKFMMLIKGALIGEGTPADPIIFTSLKDDTVAGDTNGDGSDSEPLPGDWEQVYYLNKDILVENVNIRYARYALYYDNQIHPASLTILRPTFRNCVFDYDVNGLYFRAYNAATSRSEPVISNNTFSHLTGFPVSLENTNFPAYTANTFISNLHPAILIKGTWYTSGTWTSVPGDGGVTLPYVIWTTVTISSGATVTLPGSTVVKLLDTDVDTPARLVVNGDLALDSSPSTQIVFTSYKDDYLYDTNGDGAISSPAKSDWQSIYLLNSPIQFHDSIVKYSKYGVQVRNSTALPLNPHIYNNIFEQNTYGIYLNIQGAGNITSLISGNLFNGNDYGLGTVTTENMSGSSIPTLQDNTFILHTKFPIYLGGTASPTYNNNSFSNNVHRAIALGGLFYADATLTLVPGDSNTPFNGKVFPYVVISDMTVEYGADLTVPAGAIIKFDQDKRLVFHGGLLMLSTNANNIYFTSYKDDYYDDTNADAAVSKPARGNWKGIYICTNDTPGFQYAVLKYSEYGLVINQDGNVDLVPSIENNQFSENNKAIYLLIKSDFDILSQITDNDIFSNTVGLHTFSDTTEDTRYWGCANPTLSNNSFTRHSSFPIYLNGSSDPIYSNNTFSDNTHPAIALGGYWACNATWSTVIGDNSQPFPYVVLGYITQDFYSAITIPGGTIIKFDRDKGMYSWGMLIMQSTPSNRIVFTSYRDDRYSGDTNADGTATSPTRTDWKSVWLCDYPGKSSFVHDLVAHFAVSALGVYYEGPVNTSVSTVVSNTLLEENHSGMILAIGKDYDISSSGDGDIAAELTDVTMNDNNYGLLTFARKGSTGIARPVLTRVSFTNTEVYPIYLGGTAAPSFINSVVYAPSGSQTNSTQTGELDGLPVADQPAVELSLEGRNLPGVAAYMAKLANQPAAQQQVSQPASDLVVNTLSPAIALAGVFNNAVTLSLTEPVYVVVGNYPVVLIIDGINTTVENDLTIGDTMLTPVSKINNSRVTFMGGAILKFGAGRRMTVNGGLTLMSSAASPITFTSIKDDTAGGDTNLDGNFTYPAKGNWVGVKLTSSNTIFNYARLRYATEGLHFYFAGAINQNISPEASFSTFSSNIAGITLWAAGAGDITSTVDLPSIHNNLFLDNNTHILGHVNQTPTGGASTGRLLLLIRNNDFLPTTDFGINNLSTNWTIDAINNYWGNSSGPYNSTLNPLGTGVPVSLRVNFNPWSTAPHNQNMSYTIQGRVTNSDPTDPTPGIAGVTMTLLPNNITTNTDEDGYYSFHNLPLGNYTVIPSLSAWLFAPSQFSVDLMDDATINFLGTLGTSDNYVTISNVTVSQPTSGNVNAVFKVRLSKPTAFSTVVSYKTQDGTATAGDDYVAVSNGTVSFTAGQVEKTITIVVKPGAMAEGEEFFYVTLFNPLPSPPVKLLPLADFGTCTIVVPSDFVFLPTVRK